METAAHPRFLFKQRTFDMMFVTLTSSPSFRTGVVKTFRCAARQSRMETLGMLLVLAVMLGLLGLYLWSVAWAIGDAQKRGHSGGGILVLFWLFGPLAAFIWYLTRPSTTVAERLPADYSNADDAMAAASRLDTLGDWDAAIQLYESISDRWPEHSPYTESCVDSIRRKQSLTE